VTRQRAQKGGVVQNSGRVRRDYKRRKSDRKNLAVMVTRPKICAQIYCNIAR